MHMKYVGGMGRRSVSGIGLALGLLWSSGAQAATFMWNNTGTDYNSASSWTNNAVPGAGDNAIITNTGSMTQPNLSASITNQVLTYAVGVADSVLTSSGPSVKLRLNGISTPAWRAIDIKYLVGATNTINAPIVLGAPAGSTNQFNSVAGAGLTVINGDVTEANAGVTLYLNAGPFKLLGNNNYSGDTIINGGACVGIVTNMGSVGGAAGGFGRGNTIRIYGTLSYMGPGETSGKVIDVMGTGAGRSVYLDTTGASGGLIMTADMTVSGTGTNTVYLTGDSIGNEFRGKIPDGALMMNGLQKSGTGTWTVSGSNTFSGGSKVVAGTLIIGHKNAFGTGIVNIQAATLAASTNLTGASAIPNTVSLSTGPFTVTGSNSFELGGPVTNTYSSHAITNDMSASGYFKLSGPVYLSDTEVNVRGITFKGAGTTIVSGNILSSPGVNTNNSSITISGPGMVRLSGSNSFNGTLTVNSGVVVLDSSNAVPGGIGSSGGTALIRFSSGSGVVGLNAGDFTRSAGTASNQVQWSAGGGFAAYGGNRIVNLGGASAQGSWGLNSFLSSGDPLILGASSADATVDFQNPISLISAMRTIQANRGSAVIDGIISGVISANSGYGIIKTGNGVLALTAANTYNGGTTVSNGTLLVNNATGSGTGTGLVQVVTGSTLGGTGTIAGVVNMADGTTLSPGIPGSVGTLHLSSNLTFSGSSATYTCNFTPGTCDSVQVSGTITFPATINLNVSGSGSLTTDGVLFAFQSKVGTPAWNITPSGSYTVVATSSNYVLKASSRGCLMVIQ